MVFLSLFLLAGIDQTINPKSKQTIGKNVRFGLNADEMNRLTSPIGFDQGQTGLGLRKTRTKKGVKRGFTF